MSTITVDLTIKVKNCLSGLINDLAIYLALDGKNNNIKVKNKFGQTRR